MKRNVSLEEISDGRLYSENDMVKADCHGCKGCSECCRGMGRSIILDPFDVYRLTGGLNRPFSDFLESEIELNVVDGCILPNMKMVGEQERCAFLDEDGRCSIHAFRPGVCRLFPLGRYYENGAFQYFLQKGECNAPRTKIKVAKWIDTPELRRNREYVTRWHYLLNEVEELFAESGDDTFQKNLNILLLQIFFLTPYETEADFYVQFEERVRLFREKSGLSVTPVGFESPSGEEPRG